MCDAEIGGIIGVGGVWRTCPRRSRWRIMSSSYRLMEYCDQHKVQRAAQISRGDFTGLRPATLAEWEAISPRVTDPKTRDLVELLQGAV